MPIQRIRFFAGEIGYDFNQASSTHLHQSGQVDR